MSNKISGIFFILGATLFNIFVTVASFLLLFIAYARFAAPRLPPGQRGQWVFPVFFIIAAAASFFAYRILLKRVLKKQNEKNARRRRSF